MTFEDICNAAVQTFTLSEAPTMVAIAGAESGFEPAAQGDALDSFLPSLRHVYEDWSYEGFCSFGAWQIFLPVHHEMVARLSHEESPQAMALWLHDARNNARAAREVLASQGYQAWSTYNETQYHRFINDAGVGVAAALERLKDGVTKSIVALSLASPHAHIDFDDGTFIEAILGDPEIAGEWIRFNFAQSVVIDAFQNSR